MKRSSLLFAFVLPVIIALSCSSDSDSMTISAERQQNFDFDWKFSLGDHPDAKSLNFNDSDWRQVDLPHDWSIEGKVDPKNPSGNDGGYFPTGIGWYRKKFKVPDDWQDKQAGIYFEGVYMNSEVFINGESLGVYPYGYSSFFYDLTPHLLAGEVNVIAVKVDNSLQKNCRWYSGSGIYRHVWLQVTERVHIDHWGVAITTPLVSPEKAKVAIHTRISNQTFSAQSIALSIELIDRHGNIAGKARATADIAAESKSELSQVIEVQDPQLWSPAKPDLYQALLKVEQENNVTDSTLTTFGIRSIEFSAEDGFKLNGEKIILNGGCVHHDNGCLGAAAFDRAEERKAELLKAAGFNAVRTAHNPPSEAFLEACDRLGLLVIDESFDGWRESKTPYDYAMYFDDWWKSDIEALVLRDRNHPSVIMWSTGNEIIERTKPEAIETARMLNEHVRALDPSRPVTSAMTTWGQGWEVFDPLFAEHDIGGYNYQLHYAESDHKRVPERIIVQTESYPRDAFANWKLVSENEYIIGDFVWTAMDYLGESGIGRYYYPDEPDGEHWELDLFPWHGAYCGDIDLTGWRKPISHYRSLLYNEDEKLYMAVREPDPEEGPIRETMWSVWPTWESWTWPEYEGKEIEVEIYSKHPAVRLYLNDALIGEQATTIEEEFKAIFKLAYSPGELKAVGIENGREMEEVILTTAGETAKIELSADRKEIQASGQDLCFITVELKDKDGNLQPNADNKLTFTVEGSGVIAGVDNANLKDSDPYLSNTRNAWHGRALVVIKSTDKKGDIKLTVTSPGLPDAIQIIKSK